MESIDLLVLRTARDWLAAGERCLLATVVRTWGSSPRPVGSMMVLRHDGRVVGSVSGGCIEDDLIHRYSSAYEGPGLPEGAPQLVRYGVSTDEAHRFGLPCGGTLEIVLEFAPCLQALEQLLARLDEGMLMRRHLNLATGEVALEATTTPDPFSFDGQRISNPLGPGYRMLLIGAGALAEYVAIMAQFNGFKVSVCDPRPEYMNTWTVTGVDTVVGMPDDVVRAFAPDVRTCIIALSHDPKLDDLALLEALQGPAFYIGAIGSRRNSQNRRARLIEHFGETEASLRRLHGPIGIYIGSKTPAEIAVSVMAEVLAAKNNVALPGELSVDRAKRTREQHDRCNQQPHGSQGGCVALVLAAGRAERFGSDKRKARLRSGQSLLAATLARAREVFDDVRVVLRPGDVPEQLAIDLQVDIVWAAHADDGMGASLAAGVRALEHSGAKAVAVLLGDMPWIDAQTLKQLRTLSSTDHIVLPFHQGQRGHPVVFGRRFWPALAHLQGDQGGRQVILDNADACIPVEVEDSGVLLDIDSPTDILSDQHMERVAAASAKQIQMRYNNT